MSQGPEDDAFAEVLNGITGGGSRRSGERRGLFRRRRKDDDAAVDADAEAARRLDAEDGGGAHRTPPGGTPTAWAGASRPTGPLFPYGDPALPPTTPGGIQAPGRHEFVAPDYPDGPRRRDEPPEASFVRPYAWTRGRTRPAYDLAVETLLSTTAQGRDPAQVAQYEHRMIADLCIEPRSVAEVAALLSLPLGVARVLLGDMAAHGSIVVHETASSTGDSPDMALMERVLSGLRRL
ncbi:DUF742 domain-containing protein [Actinomycetospora termitidis]|uniref:DUF742 domain-containing protein n=1 Tax=Actinomycetospora termitidis TaxID=3053470 RepID=A0ABT7MA61_9PSEU|nr:DUF742 domain-containing protein [Actinomycetospora sp. Odt1-22]MDL5157549.1 DUF742 domain-containing protein [Actinomycetospora sp. Odt1-22]